MCRLVFQLDVRRDAVRVAVGDTVQVDGDLHKGEGRVVMTCYPEKGESHGELPLGLETGCPFPQIAVAFKDRHSILYDGDDLAQGKVTLLDAKAEFQYGHHRETQPTGIAALHGGLTAGNIR